MAGSGPLAGIAPVAASANHPVWGEIAPGPHGGFEPHEFNYPYRMDVSFLRLLLRMRKRAGVPFRLVSDHRPPERNRRADGAKKSAHMQDPCRSVDLHVKNNHERFQVVQAAILEGVLRIGIYPAKEGGAGSVHVDASPTHPQPRIWTRY